MPKAWRLARSLQKLREQIDAAFPDRDKTSDGSIGDTAHSSRKSDHNPNARGVVTAIDIDEDLGPGINSIEAIVTAIRRSRDPRVKYIIYEGRITVQGTALQSWKRYTGVNAHRHHAHISVFGDESLYDDTRDWQIDSAAAPASAQNELPPNEAETPNDPLIPTAPLPTLRLGDHGDEVKLLQTKLGIKADGLFGPKTEAAVKAFQAKNGLKDDGIVGRATWAKLN